VTPSTIGGLDFAYAGALTIQDVQSLNNPGLPLISLYNQIDLIPKKVSRKTPVFSLGGANDFLRPILDGSFNFPSGTEVATNMVEVVKKVKRKGFKTQIISNLPNLGAIPFITTIGLEAPLTLLTAQFNLELRNQLRDQDIKIIQIDAANLFSLISADPAKYGFPHGTELPVPNANLAGYMFYYDGVHPSEALDRIFADYVFAQFEAANGYGALADLPLAVLRQQNNSLLQQLYPLVPCRECGTIYPFISGNVAPLLTEDQYAFSKRDGYGGNVTGGITQRLFDCLNWGAGVS
jgi:outer membrane lipase/esterase